MAKRPIFLPINDYPYIREVDIEFNWYPGFSETQAQKSINSLHGAAGDQNISPILEISTKSIQTVGVSLSAFNLDLKDFGEEPISVECAFQGSKVFEQGGPYQDLYLASSREAKRDERIRNSGDLIAFELFNENFPTEPKTAFYDWLYLTALCQNKSLAQHLLEFNGFSDIAFNPKRSINCQARSAALFVSWYRTGILERAIQSKDNYINIITLYKDYSRKPQTNKQLSFEM